MANKISFNDFIDGFKVASGMTTVDAIVMVDLFDKTKRNLCIRYVTSFSKDNIGTNTKVKIYIDKTTNMLKSYIISQSMSGTPAMGRITALLDLYKSTNTVFTLVPEMVYKNNLVPEVRKSLMLIVRPDGKCCERYRTYLYNTATDSMYPVKISPYARVDIHDVNYDDLSHIIESLGNGIAIINRAIKTRHIEDGAITPEKLDRAYVEMTELKEALVGTDGEVYESLKDRLDAIESKSSPEDIDLSDYVRKEIGKGLSTNDYTHEDKAKLEELAEKFDSMAHEPQIVFNNYLEFPNIGEEDKLYVATDENKIYVWDTETQTYKATTTTSSGGGSDLSELEVIQATL